MGMFRQCDGGWSYSQFGNFCRLLLANSTSTTIEEFATYQKPSIPANKLPKIAKELKKLTSIPELEDQRDTVKALITEMETLSREGKPLNYS